VADSTMQPVQAPHRNWRNLAACRGLDPDLFFAERGDTLTVRNARAVCATCPVAAECLEYAIANDETVGMWGGLCGDELIRERRRRAGGRKGPKPGTLRKPIEHGTDAAYHRHRAHGTTPCQPCREAHNAHKAERKAARREAAA
jgi:WhiB family redox-sensing transcriptional regulator